MARLLTLAALVLALGTFSRAYYVTDARRCNPSGGKWSTLDRQCVCYNHYAGERCDQVTRCLHGQLHNGICLCNYGWHGDLCNQIFCFYGYAVRNDTACECQPKIAGMYCDSCNIRSSTGPPLCLPQDNYDHGTAPTTVTNRNLVLEMVVALIKDLKYIMDRVPYLPLFVVASLMIKFTLFVDTAIFSGKLHEWKLRIYNVYLRLQDIELSILASASSIPLTSGHIRTTMFNRMFPTCHLGYRTLLGTMAVPTELPHNHWWRRAFHTTRRAYYNWHMDRHNESTYHPHTAPRVEPTEPAMAAYSPTAHVDIEKVLIYLVNMIFFYLCIRLFFRFMRQMRERRLERESHLATLNAQIDMLEHHVEMLNQINLHGKCRACMENEGLPNYEDVAGLQDENTHLLSEQIPIGFPPQETLQTPQVHSTQHNETQSSEVDEEPQQNNGPFLHV
ncbi:hypothetical protein QR680_010556 [Steinernema hermaphroditum]|uniref:EGF-like domain-containing protein n=1 Tax=Steinernema hermaphroditum TaxID=289476 RepID=A0AA39IRV7_9BILA|nr:hypothetical protein QR680_010556 [Steinernema hermaphroditum]